MKESNQNYMYEFCVWVHFCGQIRFTAFADVRPDGKVVGLELLKSSREADLRFGEGFYQGRPITAKEVKDAFQGGIITEHRLRKMVKSVIEDMVKSHSNYIDRPLPVENLPLENTNTHWRWFKDLIKKGQENRFGRVVCILH